MRNLNQKQTKNQLVIAYKLYKAAKVILCFKQVNFLTKLLNGKRNSTPVDVLHVRKRYFIHYSLQRIVITLFMWYEANKVFNSFITVCKG